MFLELEEEKKKEFLYINFDVSFLKDTNSFRPSTDKKYAEGKDKPQKEPFH